MPDDDSYDPFAFDEVADPAPSAAVVDESPPAEAYESLLEDPPEVEAPSSAEVVFHLEANQAVAESRETHMKRQLLQASLPYDPEAERAVIGALLVSAPHEEALRQDLIATVSPDDFHDVRHRTLWRVMRDVAAAGGALDAVTVKDALMRQGVLEAVGGIETLMSVAGAVPTTANATEYAGIVLDRARRRRVFRDSVRVARSACDMDSPLTATIGKWAEGATSLTAEATADGASFRLDAHTMLDYLDTIEPRTAVLHGLLAPQAIHVLFGPASSGKSAFCADLALTALEGITGDRQVLDRTFDMDVGDPDNPARILWIYGGEDTPERATRRMIDGWLNRGHTAEQWRALPADAIVFEQPVHDLSTPEGIAWLKQVANQHGPTLVVLDTITTLCPGLDLNSNDEVKRFITSALYPVRDSTAATIIPVCHTKKPPANQRDRNSQTFGSRLLGAGVWLGACGLAIYWGARDGNTDDIEIRVVKNKVVDDAARYIRARLDYHPQRLHVLSDEEIADADEARKSPSKGRATHGGHNRRDYIRELLDILELKGRMVYEEDFPELLGIRESTARKHIVRWREGLSLSGAARAVHPETGDTSWTYAGGPVR